MLRNRKRFFAFHGNPYNSEKKSHICKFSLTKCATILLRGYEGTFSVPSKFACLYSSYHTRRLLQCECGVCTFRSIWGNPDMEIAWFGGEGICTFCT